MLSDWDIARELGRGVLGIDPIDPAAIQPASVDLRLDNQFATWTDLGLLDPREAQSMRVTTVGDDGVFCLEAGMFALASTIETVTLPDFIAGRYEGKSSIARLGLASHVTGAFIDPGFSGQITLELANLSGRPILLRPGMAIGQVSFTYMTSSARAPYGAARGSHYHGQRGPTASRAHDQLRDAG